MSATNYLMSTPLCVQTELGEARSRMAAGACWTVHNQWLDNERYWTISIWQRYDYPRGAGFMHYELRWEPSSNIFAEDDLAIIQGKEYMEALPRWLCMA